MLQNVWRSTFKKKQTLQIHNVFFILFYLFQYFIILTRHLCLFLSPLARQLLTNGQDKWLPPMNFPKRRQTCSSFRSVERSVIQFPNNKTSRTLTAALSATVTAKRTPRAICLTSLFYSHLNKSFNFIFAHFPRSSDIFVFNVMVMVAVISY